MYVCVYVRVYAIPMEDSCINQSNAEKEILHEKKKKNRLNYRTRCARIVALLLHNMCIMCKYIMYVLTSATGLTLSDGMYEMKIYILVYKIFFFNSLYVYIHFFSDTQNHRTIVVYGFFIIGRFIKKFNSD